MRRSSPPRAHALVVALVAGAAATAGRAHADTTLVAGGSAGIEYLPVDGAQGLVLLPLAFEVGSLSDHGLEVGGGAEFAPSIGGRCTSCEGWRTRLSFHARLHVAPEAVVDPWIGVGTGVELLRVPGHTLVTIPAQYLPPGSPTTYGTRQPFYGLDIPALELGLDVRALPQLRVGAFGRGALVAYLRSTDGESPPSWMTHNLGVDVMGGVHALVATDREPALLPDAHPGRRALAIAGFALAAVSAFFAVAGFSSKDTEGVGNAAGVLGLIGVGAAVPLVVIGLQ
jgi:hypothetical protein